MTNALSVIDAAYPPHPMIAGGSCGASARVAGTDMEWLTYEFTGPRGSSSVVTRKYRKHNTVAIAKIPLITGMLGMLPPPAFDALFDDDTVELMLNPDGEMWQETHSLGMQPLCCMSDHYAWEFVRKVAGLMNRVLNDEFPTLEGCLPIDASRVTCIIPPVVDQPTFTIRKRATKVFSLNDYVTQSILSFYHCEVIRSAIGRRKNILVIGGCGTGKTTFANAILNEIAVIEPYTRQIIIEDTAELNSTARNKVNLHSSQFALITDLVKVSLRLRPDRLILGEVRGGEAWDLLQIWNTGHPGGVATLHANDCLSGLIRLKDLASQNSKNPQDIETNIVLGVDLLVHINNDGGERRIAEVVEVRDYDPTITENGGFRLNRL